MNFKSLPHKDTEQKIVKILTENNLPVSLERSCYAFIQGTALRIQIKETSEEKEMKVYKKHNRAIEEIKTKSEGKISNIKSVVVKYKKGGSTTINNDPRSSSWFRHTFGAIRKKLAPNPTFHESVEDIKFQNSDELKLGYLHSFFEEYLPDRLTTFNKTIQNAVLLGQEICNINPNKNFAQRIIMSLLQDFFPEKFKIVDAWADKSEEQKGKRDSGITEDIKDTAFRDYFDPYIQVD